MKNISSIDNRFGFFDPTQDYTVTLGQLPHWEQQGATYFITFRTADSLPRSVIDLWLRQRDDWLRRRGIDPQSEKWLRQFAELPYTAQRQFHREFAAKLEVELDNLFGECLLRQRSLSQIVSHSLRKFDGDRYHLGDFVVMPNHVHALVCFKAGVRLLKQCYSWKHFTAREINKAAGREGGFWQREGFDHLVRDVDHFEKFQRYIAENPRKAKLRNGEYIHYTIA